MVLDFYLVKFLIMLDSMLSLPILERQLVLYISEENFSEPFNLSAVPAISKDESNAQALRALTEILHTTPSENPKLSNQGLAAAEVPTLKYAKVLSEISEFKAFGQVLLTSPKPVELTEKETEYSVTALKHIFERHIVLQVSRTSLSHVDV
jgi:coatomer subunit gamma